MRVLCNLDRSEYDNQGILLAYLRQLGFSGKLTMNTYDIDTIIEVAKSQNCYRIIVSNPHTLRKIVPASRPSQEDWRGSVLTCSIPILIINPLHHTRTKPEGRWVLNNDLSKLKTAGKRFLYDYSVCHSVSEIQEANTILSHSPALVVDIETSMLNMISSIAFTPISDSLEIGHTYTIPLYPKEYQKHAKEALTIAWKTIRTLLANDSVKIFHNGCFDCFHLLRFHTPVTNWYFDTEYMWHWWRAELPKALAKVASYILPDYYYWKHESDLSPLEYNAKDTINTARVFIYLLSSMPKWAWKNYAMNFPIAVPAIKCHFEGILIDEEKRAGLRTEAYSTKESLQEQLNKSAGFEINVNSPKQVSTFLYSILKASRPARAKSKSATGIIELKKISLQNPLVAYFVELILRIREERKAISTYYEARLTENSRLLYSLNPDGTETERMSCTASTMYAPFSDLQSINKSNAKNLGTQLQNLPPYYKKACMADPGYMLMEVDKEQAEARCTAYLSGDEKLKTALETPGRDFYCHTGFLFFGIKFDKNDPLRQVIKKIIHGTNYIMGAQTFIDTVGILKIREYMKLLGLTNMPVLDFAKYLLGLYHDAYPGVEEWWDRIVIEIANTSKLVTPDGWTREFLGKMDHKLKKEAVAHCSQHFSVRGINEAFWRAYYELEIPSKGAYRLKGQIHDSLLQQVLRESVHYYRAELLRIMDIPQPTGSGTLRIPLDVKVSTYWKE